MGTKTLVRIKICIKFFFLTLFSTITSLYPLYGAGTSSADFLKIAPGAKPSGMGETFTAIADDASAIYWNAAGLSSLKCHRTASFT